jgi:hypothetical protein
MSNKPDHFEEEGDEKSLDPEIRIAMDLIEPRLNQMALARQLPEDYVFLVVLGRKNRLKVFAYDKIIGALRTGSVMPPGAEPPGLSKIKGSYLVLIISGKGHEAIWRQYYEISPVMKGGIV